MLDAIIETLRNPQRLAEEVGSSVMLRVATEVCLERLRGRSRWPGGNVGELAHRIANTTTLSTDSAKRSWWDRLFSRETVSGQALAVMVLIDGMSIGDTARQVKMSPGAVRRRLEGLSEQVIELRGALA